MRRHRRVIVAVLVLIATAVAVPAYGSDPLRAKIAALERKVATLEAKLGKQETDNRALRRRLDAREAERRRFEARSQVRRRVR